MIEFLRRSLPASVKDFIRQIKANQVEPLLKAILFYRMQKKHKLLIEGKKNKKSLRVVFLAIHRSVWKVDSVFQKMLQDPFFDPVVLVCPYTSYGDERMWADMNEAMEYFTEKGYKTISSYNSDTKEWIKLSELEPDIVFFTNPHNLTKKEYYQEAFYNYLSCYVPYHHEVGSYGGNISQYNGFFHNAMWLIFSSQKSSFELFKRKSAGKAKNVIVTGYPAMEDLYLKLKNNSYENAWKNKSSKLKIIWAPHHTIDSPELPYSNFLKYADVMKEFVHIYAQDIVWSFKPHPILKAKLLEHKDWGKEKTNNYYSFWEENTSTQLDEGEYTSLFCSSDALIHDSGSFLAEYLYTKKPVLYLMSEKNSSDFYSDFGIKALSATRKGFSVEDIRAFIESLIARKEIISDEYQQFYLQEIEVFFSSTMPSDRILKEIKRAIK